MENGEREREDVLPLTARRAGAEVRASSASNDEAVTWSTNRRNHENYHLIASFASTIHPFIHPSIHPATAWSLHQITRFSPDMIIEIVEIIADRWLVTSTAEMVAIQLTSHWRRDNWNNGVWWMHWDNYWEVDLIEIAEVDKFILRDLNGKVFQFNWIDFILIVEIITGSCNSLNSWKIVEIQWTN